MAVPHVQPSALLPTGALKPWFWEGNVQAVVVGWLKNQGCVIHSSANTATKERGKDIVGERNRLPVWLTVKGYPEGTAKTNPSVQAGHWFKQAVFDIIAYRGENQGAELGLVLPDFPPYRALAQKIGWFQPVAKFNYYWVQETGEVIVG